MKLFGIRITPMRLAVTAAVVAFSMLHPVIRKIVWIILPMGRGTDDIVFWIAFTILCLVGFVEFWVSFQPGNQKKREQGRYYE